MAAAEKLPEGVKGVVKFEDISRAKYRIRDGIMMTPCTPASKTLNDRVGGTLYFKQEFKFPTGSFKERGARNALKSLSAEQKQRGVIAASAGNHALGLAHHGASLNIPVTLVMPRFAPLTKVHKCRALGARIVLHGEHILEAMEKAQEFVEQEQLAYINGFDDPEIIAGQGTVGLEILEQVEGIDM